MQEIKRISKRSGGDLFEVRDATGLLRTLANHSQSWQLLIETPLGLYNPQYSIEIKKGGTQKDRLKKIDATAEKFNVQIAKIVGLTRTEYPSEIRNVKVELRQSKDMSYLIARMISVETEEGSVEFDIPFTANCLTFTEEFKSKLWIYHLNNLLQRDPFVYLQAAKRIDSFCREVVDYKNKEKPLTETLENNLLLLSRFWEWLGIELGLHVSRFPDQPYAIFSMTGQGRLKRGVELKYDSKGYTRAKYKSKSQGREMVILCFVHNDKNLLKGEDYLDVIDASELGEFMMSELTKIETKQDPEEKDK